MTYEGRHTPQNLPTMELSHKKLLRMSLIDEYQWRFKMLHEFLMTGEYPLEDVRSMLLELDTWFLMETQRTFDTPPES